MRNTWAERATRRDWLELQLWEMRRAGLDSAVWIHGDGPIDFWGPMRAKVARDDYQAIVQWVYWPVPMTLRWLRA